MVLAIRTGLPLIVLSACAVKISQHAVAGCFILTRVGLTEVRVPTALHLHTHRDENEGFKNK